MVAIVALPPLVAYMLYLNWRPESRMNYGELIKPVPLAEAVPASDPAMLELAKLRGKWVLLTIDGGGCDDYCRSKLYIVRQLRLTQGQDLERIERAWLVDDTSASDPALLEEYRGTVRVAAHNSVLLTALPVASRLRDHIYLIDPLGNVMLRYPRDPDPNKMKKDLNRLLRASRIG